jgi:hypothetical protein
VKDIECYFFLEDRKMKKVLIVLAVLAVSGMASAELLSNPGFEAGAWSGWGQGYVSWGGASFYASQSLVTDAAVARSGNNYMTAGNSGWYWGYSFVWETVTVTPGTSYQMSGYFMDDNGSPGATGFVDGKVRLQWFDSSDTPILFDDNGIAVLSDWDLGWQQFSVTGVAPANAAYVRATLGQDGGGGQTVRIDDASMALVPEPATMALLGLGGLLLRRKK